MSRFHGTRQRRAFDVWQIVYIDLMTNVMIFFVVLWAGTSAVKKKTTGVSDTFGTETVKTVNLPGDVLFAVGKSDISDNGHQVFQKLFSDSKTVLDFDTGGLTKRVLVIQRGTPTTTARRTRTSSSASSAPWRRTTRSPSTAAASPTTSSSALTPTTRRPRRSPPSAAT